MFCPAHIRTVYWSDYVVKCLLAAEEEKNPDSYRPLSKQQLRQQKFQNALYRMIKQMTPLDDVSSNLYE